MNQHAKAALTKKQRQEVKLLYRSGQFSQAQLAVRFATSVKTIRKWVHRETPYDRSSAPKTPHRRVTESYRQAVLAYRRAHPTHGPVRIQAELEPVHGHFAFSTVRLILQEAALSHPKRAKPPQDAAIPVGRHRTQMDVQQLPAVAGGQGFQYKISIIHLSTRIKYSEIHDNYESATIASVFQRAWDALPPF
jgi:transposase